MRRLVAACALAAATVVAGPVSAEVSRGAFVAKLRDAEEVVEASRIPRSVLARARAIAIFPGVIKAGLIWGGRHGEGVVLARLDDGSWSAPAYFTITGGSYGLQIGVQSADVVLVVMNDRGLRALLKQRFTLGADAEAAAGPESASAEADVDVALKADIYSYSRARGLFAGVSVDGARVAAHRAMNEAFYGHPYPVDEIIVTGTVPVPGEARGLIRALETRAGE